MAARRSIPFAPRLRSVGMSALVLSSLEYVASAIGHALLPDGHSCQISQLLTIIVRAPKGHGYKIF
jgi:hypothetical protein